MNWLRAEIARDERQGKSFRTAHPERAQALGVALSTAEAYAWFGTFLGLFPPFALFCRMFLSGIKSNEALGIGLFCLGMNAVCCLVGRRFGAYLGRKIGDPGAWTWPMYIFSSLLMAVAWALVTGAAGGAVAFGFGAVFGIICAVPVALVAFPLFATLHRWAARGGMIEERQLWPLVFGIPIIIAALILSPGIYAY